MEDVEKSLLIIHKHCLKNYKNCIDCEIEKACTKYFNREPRRWKLPKEWEETNE